MKTLKITLAALLLTSVTFAQTHVDEVELTEKKIQVKKASDGTIYKTKHIIETERIKPVLLEKEDRYNLNQDLKMVPVSVTKKIMLDYDRDDAIDREVVVTYKDDYDMSLDMRLTPYGLLIANDVENIKNSDSMNVIYNNRIVEKGTYEVTLSDGEKIEVCVEEFEMK